MHDPELFAKVVDAVQTGAGWTFASAKAVALIELDHAVALVSVGEQLLVDEFLHFGIRQTVLRTRGVRGRALTLEHGEVFWMRFVQRRRYGLVMRMAAVVAVPGRWEEVVRHVVDGVEVATNGVADCGDDADAAIVRHGDLVCRQAGYDVDHWENGVRKAFAEHERGLE